MIRTERGTFESDRMGVACETSGVRDNAGCPMTAKQMRVTSQSHRMKPWGNHPRCAHRTTDILSQFVGKSGRLSERKSFSSTDGTKQQWKSSKPPPIRPSALVRPSQNPDTVRRSNPDEVRKFAALSNTWWDPTRNPLLAMNVARVQFICNAVQRNQERNQSVPPNENRNQVAAKSNSNSSCSFSLPFLGLKALDIGCGGGVLSESLARLGAETVGIDPSHALIASAEQHAHQHMNRDTRQRLRYVPGMTVQEFAEESSTGGNSSSQSVSPLYDIVCCLEVIEHVPEPAALLTTACQLLKPETGLLFVSTINRTYQSYWSTIIGAEYLLGLLPIGTHDWSAYRSPHDVAQLLPQMETVETTGMVLPLSFAVPFSMVPALLRLQSTGSVAANWKWQLDPNDTNVNWISCYKKRPSVEVAP